MSGSVEILVTDASMYCKSRQVIISLSFLFHRMALLCLFPLHGRHVEHLRSIPYYSASNHAHGRLFGMRAPACRPWSWVLERSSIKCVSSACFQVLFHRRAVKRGTSVENLGGGNWNAVEGRVISAVFILDFVIIDICYTSLLIVFPPVAYICYGSFHISFLPVLRYRFPSPAPVPPPRAFPRLSGRRAPPRRASRNPCY